MKNRTELPSYELLHKHFNYCPESGLLTWKIPTSNRAKKGQVAGNKICASGHLSVGIFGGNYLIHRIAWKMMLNEEPPQEIDHKDVNPKNNAWLNLRVADRHNNMANTNIYSSNTSGFKGVSFHKASGKWRARITVNYKDKVIGYFDTKEEAAKVRKEFAENLHKEYARETL